MSEEKPKRGFARDPEKAREAGRKGGLAVSPEKRSFSKNPELAREAGRKGGQRRGVRHASALDGKAGTLCGVSSEAPTSSTYADCRKCARILRQHGGERGPGGGWYYPQGWVE